MAYFQYIKESLFLNWKTWLYLFVSVYWITKPGSYLYGILTLFISIISSHLTHYMLHHPLSYPLNISHIYHHDHNNFMSHFIQILLEFVALLAMIGCKFVCNIYSLIDLSFLNDYVLIFFYLVYTTIHNINYSIYHVNHVHEIHHKVYFQNMGPDICDLVFNTKYKPEEGVEDTNHYTLNIIGALLATLCLKYLIGPRNLFDTPFKYLYVGIYLLFVVISIYLYLDTLKKENNEFDEKIRKLVLLAKMSPPIAQD